MIGGIVFNKKFGQSAKSMHSSAADDVTHNIFFNFIHQQ